MKLNPVRILIDLIEKRGFVVVDCLRLPFSSAGVFFANVEK